MNADIGMDDKAVDAAALFDPRSEPAALPAAVPDALLASFARGGRFAFLSAADGTRLRYAHWRTIAGPSKGRVVVLGGRGEFVEKYATEIVGELLGRGFDVFSMDWRGQGLSQRALPDPEKGHVEDFALYREDLHRFLTIVVGARGGESAAENPVLLLAHSMGGLATLRLLAEHAPEKLASAALICAPMTGLKHALAIRAALLLAPHGSRREKDYALGAGPFSEGRRSFAENRVTHDGRRYRFTDQWFAAEPRLRLGGPTYEWLRAGMAGVETVMQPGFLARIDVPVLLLSARLDALVEPASHDTVAKLSPRVTIKHYDDSKHEIMMETDAIRARFWTDFDRFVAKLD
ncbi:MAG: alpha/beta hydrolase [Rhodospirillales bacterium]